MMANIIYRYFQGQAVIAECSPDAGGHVEINQRREVVWVDALIEDADGAKAVIEILRRYIDTGSIAPEEAA